MKESELQQLLRFVCSGGGYIHTYPDRDANQRAIHAACCILEQRGLIRRIIDTEDSVCFQVIAVEGKTID